MTTNKSSNSKNSNQKRYQIRQMFQRAKDLERKGQWSKAASILETILSDDWDPTDAYSHLALAKLEARRRNHHTQNHGSSSNGRSNSTTTTSTTTTIATQQTTTTTAGADVAVAAFERGTRLCPNSVHLWQAWAIYEEQMGRTSKARELLERALQLDPYNAHVCHAYGLLERKLGGQDGEQKAQALWQRALHKTSTAALVCSLGELYIAQKQYDAAHDLYAQHIVRVQSQREKTEVYLASAWLEERYFFNYTRAHELLLQALELNPTSSLAQIALARLEGRHGAAKNGDLKRATVRRLAQACKQTQQQKQQQPVVATEPKDSTRGYASNDLQLLRSPQQQQKQHQPPQPQDGRVYNAWAAMEVQSGRPAVARKILHQGLERLHGKDHSLLQAAGKIEERFGNYSGARDLYRASLYIQPSAPTLVSYALLELKHPEISASSSPGVSSRNNSSSSSSSSNTGECNFTQVRQLLEEALLLDPRHGPAYNSYGNAEFQRGNIEKARQVFQRGVQAQCSDAASVYHGYAKLELALGNVNRARELLLQGRQKAHLHEVGMDSPHRERTCFLTHTLGMLELNSHRPADALAVFIDGIERYGNSSQLLLGAALAENKLGNEYRARLLFERSVLADEKHAQAWQAWGCMEMRAGNWTTAKTLLECGIKSCPRHGALWLAYATLHGRMGHVELSRALFAKGVRKAPRHAPLYQAWASLELRQDNISAAKTLITEALTRDKRNGSGWLVAAEIERRLGNTPLQSLILRRGIECSPAHAALYRALGDALLRQNTINEARGIYEQGIEIDPLHAPLYHALAELEARVCNIEGLSKLNKRAALVFRTNTLESSSSSSSSRRDGVSPSNAGQDAWSKRIRAGNNARRIPQGIAALAQRIVEDDGNDRDGDGEALIGFPLDQKMSAMIHDDDPNTAAAAILLESLSASLMDEEGDLIDGLLTDRQEKQ
jgi:tetratricopeptide (TPR) repeat protein